MENLEHELREMQEREQQIRKKYDMVVGDYQRDFPPILAI